MELQVACALSGLGSGLSLLESYEAIALAWCKPDTGNLSELREKVPELFFSDLRVDVLDIEVVELHRLLELEGLLGQLFSALLLGYLLAHIQLLSRAFAVRI